MASQVYYYFAIIYVKINFTLPGTVNPEENCCYVAHNLRQQPIYDFEVSLLIWGGGGFF